jgi:hypothetical protein
MDNIVIDSSDSDSDYEESSDGHSDREEVVYESEHFLNHIKKNQYETNRNKLFTPDIEEIDIIVESPISGSGVNDYTYPLYSKSQSTGGHGEYKNVIGINLISACVSQTNSSLNHFVNICVENIPYNACIHNKNGEHILGRMCMTKGSGLLNEFEPDNIKLNYFYPITLHEIKIKLMCKYTNTNVWDDYNSNLNNSFVFRLTLLKNLNLLK